MQNIINLISDFKKYEMTLSEKNGEYETYCTKWTDIYTEFIKTIEKTDVYNVENIDYLYDMIYIIARDNECENIIDELTQYKSWFEILSKYSLNTDEYNAKWQFAHYLGQYVEKHGNNEYAKELILKFLEDENEYVKRRALLILHKILPEKIEYYSEKFWNNNFDEEINQYQKMAVLSALYNIKSKKLKYYLNEIEKLDNNKYNYLINYANEIKNNN